MGRAGGYVIPEEEKQRISATRKRTANFQKAVYEAGQRVLIAAQTGDTDSVVAVATAELDRITEEFGELTFRLAPAGAAS